MIVLLNFVLFEYYSLSTMLMLETLCLLIWHNILMMRFGFRLFNVFKKFKQKHTNFKYRKAYRSHIPWPILDLPILTTFLVACSFLTSKFSKSSNVWHRFWRNAMVLVKDDINMASHTVENTINRPEVFRVSC